MALPDALSRQAEILQKTYLKWYFTAVKCHCIRVHGDYSGSTRLRIFGRQVKYKETLGFFGGRGQRDCGF